MTKQLFLSTTVNAALVNVPSLLINHSPTNHNGEKSLNSISYHTLFFVLVLGKAYENFQDVPPPILQDHNHNFLQLCQRHVLITRRVEKGVSDRHLLYYNQNNQTASPKNK